MQNVDYKKEEISALIQYSQQGNIKALEELIRRIQKDVFALFSYLVDKRQDISDLTQEALLKIAKNIKSLHEIKSFKSWMNQIAANVFHDYVKKNKSDKNIEHDNEKLLEIKDKAGCEPGEKCLYSEIDKVIKAALLDLPGKLRIVIILREFEGLSYEEISKITESSIGTVKSRIARARTRLQNQLREFI